MYTGLGIGEDFIPHNLAVFLDEEIPELKDINFSTPEDYIRIEDEEIAVSHNWICFHGFLIKEAYLIFINLKMFLIVGFKN